jgi:conjugal transfer ATP-binding protein TraC
MPAVPRLDEPADQRAALKWYLPRYSASGVYERMAKHRVDFLTDGVWNSLSADAPFCLRNHRVAISYSTPESSRVSTEEIVSVMDGLISVLARSGSPRARWTRSR